MRFDEVIQQPVGTIIRRASWPLHWWLTIVGAPLPARCGPGIPPGTALSYTALSNDGPFGGALRGDILRVTKISLDDATAIDWEASATPPLDIIEPTPGKQPAPFSLAIYVDGTLMPLRSLPMTAEGYRAEELVRPDLPEGYRIVQVLVRGECSQ